MAKGGVDRWNHIFRIACVLEDLFNTGLQAPRHTRSYPTESTPWKGSYAAERVVAYLPGSSVMGFSKTRGNHGKVIGDAMVSARPQSDPSYNGIMECHRNHRNVLERVR